MIPIMNTRQLLLLLIFVSWAETAQADYPLKPVPFNEVEITSDFWRPRLETQRKTLVPFAFEKTQPGVEHLQAARDFLAGKTVEGHRPHRFIDSDLYKVMEGAAYLARLKDDPELEAQFDRIVDVIAAAQEPDGYLYPSHTTGVGEARNMMGDSPYTYVVHSHELYNMEADPAEIENLASNPEFERTLINLQDRLRAFQEASGDPWVVKYKYE